MWSGPLGQIRIQSRSSGQQLCIEKIKCSVVLWFYYFILFTYAMKKCTWDDSFAHIATHVSVLTSLCYHTVSLLLPCVKLRANVLSCELWLHIPSNEASDALSQFRPWCCWNGSRASPAVQKHQDKTHKWKGKVTEAEGFLRTLWGDSEKKCEFDRKRGKRSNREAWEGEGRGLSPNSWLWLQNQLQTKDEG